MKHAQFGRGLLGVRAQAGPANDPSGAEIDNAASGAEIRATIDALGKAWGDFRAEHTEQLSQVKSGFADVVKTEKVEKINAHVGELQSTVDALNAKLAHMDISGGGAPAGDPEYHAAFTAHMKRGEVQANLNKGADSEGGYLAPVEWDRTITDKLIEVSPMRSLASVQTIGTNGFRKLFNARGASSGWVGETDARPETATPALGSLTYVTGELYANPSATQQMLDDAEINLESWLAGEVETEFAYQEGAAFLSGDGADKPSGILTYIAGGAKAAAHPWGAIATVDSGAAAAITADGLYELIYALPSAFSSAARLIMNRNTLKSIRLLKDGNGNYLWQPTATAGQPGAIGGYPFTEVAGMPDVAANSNPVLFGDFKRGYLVVDRAGVRVLRDPFTNKPFVNFYTTKRVGGGLLNPEVLRALTIAA